MVNQKEDQGIGFHPVLDGVVRLTLKTQVCSLGVFLDSFLCLDAQVSAVARRAFAQLKLVIQLCSFLEMPNLSIADLLQAGIGLSLQASLFLASGCLRRGPERGAAVCACMFNTFSG